MKVDIIPLGAVHDDVLQGATDGLKEAYGADVSQMPARPLPETAFNPYRRQYNATVLLEFLVVSIPSGRRSIALTAIDLYAPSMSFVFGQAQLPGYVALASVFRLRPDQGDGDGERFISRVRTEVVHEMGHTLGFDHCPARRCVMRFSLTVVDTDEKGERFCSGCTERLADLCRHA